MKVVVIADDSQKEELLAQGVQEDTELVWQKEVVKIEGAEAYIDLLFDRSSKRMANLNELQPAFLVINSVNTISGELTGMIRINGWPGFLKRSLVEASGDVRHQPMAEKIFGCFNKKTEWVPDIPGFITARVVSMIINEAWFALGEKVSSKEAIDTAMKLGTNYPYGPFEWGEKIGLSKVYDLLQTLTSTNKRYQPANLLQQQVLAE